MGKFYLVDQSLKGLGGHHFDYTNLLSTAAQEAEWPVVIGCHRRFGSAESLPGCEVRNSFRNTTYANCSTLVGIQDMVSKRHKSGWLDFIGRWFGRDRNSDKADSDEASNLRARRDSLFRKRQKRIRTFKEDCHEFFERPLTREDVVFLTTLSDLEADGLYQFIRERPDAKLANWHLQFHFPVFRGRTQDYESQFDQIDYLVRTLRKLTTLSQTNIQFYVTSDTLLDQYRRTGFHFKELPYPVNPGLRSDQPKKSPASPLIRLAFAGAIRNEKGGDQIQNLIEQLDSSVLSQVQLCVQKKRPKLTARIRNWFKREQASEFIDVHSYPLSASDYQDYIRSADIGLLTTYDSETYFSRRAGILGEYLAAGVPVIVPAGSWLSDQIEGEQRKYLRQVLSDCDTDTLSPKNLTSRSTGKTIVTFELHEHKRRIPFSDSALSVLSFDVIRPAEHGHYFRVNLLDESGKPNLERTQIVGRERGTTNTTVNQTVLVPWNLVELTDEAVRFEISSAYGSGEWQLENVQLKTVAGHQPIPRSVVGLVAADPAQTASLISEMVDQFVHYRSSARKYSRPWFERHDPAATLQTIIERSEFSKTNSDQAA